MTIGTSRAIVVGIVILGAAAAGFLYYSKNTDEYDAITNFAECKMAGYTIEGTSRPLMCHAPDGRTFVEDVATTTPNGTATTTGKEDKIQVTNIRTNQIITSPLIVEGKARGYWYFEASFPVELLDGNGKNIAAGPAQAKGEWMTTDFVPFSITLSFAKPSTATGTLILKNDNPSGLPENQDEIRIPIRFSTAERTVKLYYYDSSKDLDTSGQIACSSQGLVAVNRTIPVTLTPIQDTIRMLLGGEITPQEKSRGITTEFPLAGVSLIGASLGNNGTLTLSISDPSFRTSGGACRVQVLRAQIIATARQFAEVSSVVFSPAEIFQP